MVAPLSIIFNDDYKGQFQDELQKRISVYKEELLSGPNAVKIPDISKNGNKIMNIRVTELTLCDPPAIELVPGVGIRTKQKASAITVQADFKKKILRTVPINQRFALTTSVTLVVTIGITGSEDACELKPELKEFIMDFHTLDLDLNKNPILVDVFSLFPSIHDSIKGGIEKSVRQAIIKSISGLDLMVNIPLQNESDRDLMRPRFEFKTDRIEFYSGLEWEKDLGALSWHDSADIISLPKNGSSMIYLIASMKLLDILLGNEVVRKLALLMKVKKLIPNIIYKKVQKRASKKFLPTYLRNLGMDKKREFFVVYFDLQIDDLIDKIEDFAKCKNQNEENNSDSENHCNA